MGKGMNKEHCICIYPDCDYIYQNEEGCVGGSTDDEISNSERSMQPLFSIILPGISEWCKRYVDKTDFTRCETNPLFDWKRWHYDGLLFAKELYRQLPRNYNLKYKSPYKDKSGTLPEIDFSKDDVDSIIASLGNHPYLPDAKPSYKYNVSIQISAEEDHTVSIELNVGNHNYTIQRIPLEKLKHIKTWMERVAYNNEDVIQIELSCIYMQIIPQKIGQFIQMGQIRVVDKNNVDMFSAYIDRREFVRCLYLALMNHFGFGLYTTTDFKNVNYPQNEDLVKLWQPYNDLKSDVIEWYITDDLYYNSPMPPERTGNQQVNETVVIFPDYGCCMWDTMGYGCGDEDGLFLESGKYSMDIPGLKEWNGRWGTPDVQAPDYENWWQEGWRIAKEIRKRLPLSIDIYYMCLDPLCPEAHPDYAYYLLKIIVPYQQ